MQIVLRSSGKKGGRKALHSYMSSFPNHCHCHKIFCQTIDIYSHPKRELFCPTELVPSHGANLTPGAVNMMAKVTAWLQIRLAASLDLFRLTD